MGVTGRRWVGWEPGVPGVPMGFLLGSDVCSAGPVVWVVGYRWRGHHRGGGVHRLEFLTPPGGGGVLDLTGVESGRTVGGPGCPLGDRLQ